MVNKIGEYALGDMKACYFMEQESKNVECMLLPLELSPLNWEEKKQELDSLVQIKLIGDDYPGAYAGGMTMRQGESVKRFQYISQEIKEEDGQIVILTCLEDDRGHELNHYLVWKKGKTSVECYTEFINHGEEAAQLEMLSSFSLGGISPYLIGDGYDQLVVHRIRSVWSMEGRLDTQTVEQMQLEPSWAGHAIRAERFGQVGSMAVNHFFPYIAVEDTKNQIIWGAQLAHNASWQIELYRKDEGLAISGGIADREFGHWMKKVDPGESFITPKAILSVCKGGGIDEISHRLTSHLDDIVSNGPKSEETLPIIFNEYCTTWGNPSHENIRKILEKVKDKGISYFVIDCGWYKQPGVPWDIAMGDYEVSKELFPEGLSTTVAAIKEVGLKPGIWFEIENVGKASRAYQDQKYLLKRDGITLTTCMRRFWDMRDPWVKQYLTEKVIGMMKRYGFEYLKVDYNETIGIGCDGAESLGEGLRQNMEAAYSFLEKVKAEIPGVVIENCASGGHRLDPKMMELCAMASFSDAHECEEIPIIAANLHRVILPRQSQIWAVIRKEDSKKRIAYSMINTFLGRMCLSGGVVDLTEEQWKLIDQGIAFYKIIAPIICEGMTKRFGPEVTSYRHPEGWQGILRSGTQEDVMVLYHVFHKCKEEVLTIPLGGEYDIKQIYSDSEVRIESKDGVLRYYPEEEMKAVAVYLKKSGMMEE